jgi:hypothetical protein
LDYLAHFLRKMQANPTFSSYLHVAAREGGDFNADESGSSGGGEEEGGSSTDPRQKYKQFQTAEDLHNFLQLPIVLRRLRYSFPAEQLTNRKQLKSAFNFFLQSCVGLEDTTNRSSMQLTGVDISFISEELQEEICYFYTTLAVR